MSAWARVLVAAGMAMLLGGAAAAQETRTQLTLEEILARLNRANPGLSTFIVEQNVDLRALIIFSWRVHTTVYASRPASYKVVVHDPPAILRSVGTVFSDISTPEKLLADYRLKALQALPGDQIDLEMAGARPSVNPGAVRATIDTRQWLVKELAGTYDWGEVRILYRYEDVQGYMLPVSAAVRLYGFPVRADLTYFNYQLNASLPDSIFDPGSTP